MIRDKFLQFAENNRPSAFPVPTAVAGGVIGAGMDYLPAPFANGFLDPANVVSWDLQAIMDLGQGSARLKARFDVVTAFVDPNVAEGDKNLARFCVLMSPVESLTVNTIIVARSGSGGPGVAHTGFSATVLVPGFSAEIIIPQLHSLARLGADGYRYVGLAMELRVPDTDFSDGGVDARIMLDTEQEQFDGLRNYASGFNVE